MGREALQAQQAKERYQKMHAERETDEGGCFGHWRQEERPWRQEEVEGVSGVLEVACTLWGGLIRDVHATLLHKLCVPDLHHDEERSICRRRKKKTMIPMRLRWSRHLCIDDSNME